MNAKIFVDTNVLVYSRDASEPEKQRQAMSWLSHLWMERSGRLSFQVLQEFYVTVTEKLDPGLSPEDARGDVLSLLTWGPLPTSGEIMEGAWSIQDRFGLSWWDSLIVSAGRLADCRYLLTEDLQADQMFGDIQVIDPFMRSPNSLS
jgi:predicted nucleic acid-binding protein